MNTLITISNSARQLIKPFIWLIVSVIHFAIYVPLYNVHKWLGLHKICNYLTKGMDFINESYESI